MTFGSQELRIFRCAIRDGASLEDACDQSGIGIAEGRMHVKDDEKNPPPPEAYELLGHNSGQTTMSDSQVIAADEIRLLIERVERLQEEQKGLADDVKDVFAEAKSRGYDVKTLRMLVRLRRMESHHRDEAAALLETYANALGMQGAFLL